MRPRRAGRPRPRRSTPASTPPRRADRRARSAPRAAGSQAGDGHGPGGVCDAPAGRRGRATRGCEPPVRRHVPGRRDHGRRHLLAAPGAVRAVAPYERAHRPSPRRLQRGALARRTTSVGRCGAQPSVRSAPGSRRPPSADEREAAGARRRSAPASHDAMEADAEPRLARRSPGVALEAGCLEPALDAGETSGVPRTPSSTRPRRSVRTATAARGRSAAMSSLDTFPRSARDDQVGGDGAGTGVRGAGIGDAQRRSRPGPAPSMRADSAAAFSGRARPAGRRGRRPAGGWRSR